jgi:hypothetical protein
VARLLTIAACCLPVAGLVTGPAMADPSGSPTYRALNGVGAGGDEALMNAMSNVILDNSNTKVIGSYDAQGTGTIATQASPNCSITRPSGSGAGINALLQSLAQGSNCIQFARTTITPASTSLKYVHFVDDAIGYAINSTNISIPRGLSTAQLQGIYTCNPAYVGIGPNYTMTALLPQSGPVGVRGLWEAKMGITDADVVAGKYPCISDHVKGQPVTENDGRFLNDSSIEPYSVAYYNAQSFQTIQDVRAGAILGSIDGSAAQVTNPSIVPRSTVATYAITSSNVSIPRQLTGAELRSIYTCDPAFVGTGPNYTITPLLPAGLSNVRGDWETAMGITDADVLAGKYPCISDHVNGQPIAPNDGRFLTDTSIEPYAVPDYLNQYNQSGVQDVRGQAVLGTMDGAVPVTLDPAYPNQFPYYNAISATTTDPTLTSVFLTPNSKLCAQTSLIATYGFLKDPACGT